MCWQHQQCQQYPDNLDRPGYLLHLLHPLHQQCLQWLQFLDCLQYLQWLRCLLCLYCLYLLDYQLLPDYHYWRSLAHQYLSSHLCHWLHRAQYQLNQWHLVIQHHT